MTDVSRRAVAIGGALGAMAVIIPGSALAVMPPRQSAGGDASASDYSLAAVAPELRPAARRMLAMGQLRLTDASLASIRLQPPPPAMPLADGVSVTEQVVPVGHGVPPVRVYVVNAVGGAARPAILHTHGGGFILGSAKQEVPRLQALAADLDCTIVTVEYALAPEARYTVSLEQNYAALRWLHSNATRLGVDPARIALMGESAGGGHAAMLAFAARDRREVPVIFQLLVYPMLDDRTGSTRHLPSRFGSIGWDPASNVFGWRSLLGVAPGGAAAPASIVPARRDDLAGLCPAFIGVGGIDLFASEDIDYARRLLESGVAVQLNVVPGAFHGFDAIAADTDLALTFNAAKNSALRRAFK